MTQDGAAQPLARSDLDAALAESRISARYQPLVRIADRQPIGLEVLARLEHPSRGTLTAECFVPQMEAAGLAWSLTQAVVQRAFGEFDGARLIGLGLSLAVNFTLDGLLRPDAAAWLAGACAGAGIPPARVTVELTESQVVADREAVRAGAQRLRAAGFSLAIDDVGPTVRDHRPLLGLAFNVMKLDRALVTRSGAQPEAFLAQALAAAKSAGMVVIAEGVESEDTWRRMAGLGVEQAQGYLIGVPLPAAEVEEWRRAWLAPRAGAS